MGSSTVTPREIATFPDATVSLIREKGILEIGCTCSRYRIRNSCKHVIKAMADRFDAVDTFGINKIPIFITPTHPLSVHVDIRDEPDWADPPLQAVYLILENSTMRTTSFIGYITDGDGRVDIRQMVLEYLIGLAEQAYWTQPAVQCESPHHRGDNFILSNFPEATKQELSAKIVDYWNWLEGGTCTACADAATIPI